MQVVYLKKLPRVANTKRFPSAKGARRPAHCSTVGKVLLANREWEQLAPLLEAAGLRAFSPNTITDLGELAEELEALAERGYAYDYEESSTGLCYVAAPIYGRRAKVVAAASLCMPRHRFEQMKERYAAAIVEAARLITTGACRRMRAFDPNLEKG